MYIRSFYSTRFSFFVKKLKPCLFQWSCISFTRIEKRNKETPQCSKKYIPLSPPWFFRVLRINKKMVQSCTNSWLKFPISKVILFYFTSMKPIFIVEPNLARMVNAKWRDLKWGMVCPCDSNCSRNMSTIPHLKALRNCFDIFEWNLCLEVGRRRKNMYMYYTIWSLEPILISKI